ncbi:MAG: hypothetical protein V7K25_21875 [Nostoc sp.]
MADHLQAIPKSVSRENWKKRAMKAEKELRILHVNVFDGQRKGKKFPKK